MKNLYHILGLNSNASLMEIKKAYRKLALEWHPDKNSHPDAQQKFIEINEAYLILSDVEARKKYDAEHEAFSSTKRQYQQENTEDPHSSNTKDKGVFEDEELNRWFRNASKQAEKFAAMSYQQFSKLLIQVLKETGKQVGNSLMYGIGLTFLFPSIMSVIYGFSSQNVEAIFLGFFFAGLSWWAVSSSSKNVNIYE